MKVEKNKFKVNIQATVEYWNEPGMNSKKVNSYVTREILRFLRNECSYVDLDDTGDINTRKINYKKTNYKIVLDSSCNL